MKKSSPQAPVENGQHDPSPRRLSPKLRFFRSPTEAAVGAGRSKSPQPHPTPPKSAGWKKSKFFRKTMCSGEILRGLKKLSLGQDDRRRDPNDESSSSSSRGGVKGIVARKEDILSILSTAQAPLATPPKVVAPPEVVVLPDKAVQWDDGDAFDPSLLGGAIEDFLRGSMGPSEKHVSFKQKT
ncbi:hypothetical protein LAZ67_22002115 [Cordylochernes scorpioides]|uniref:Uncharacterized protein n=1 Tax=Cordylochernes scorpioides TaxID=51811 RepID=A0ABY6LQF1_9ARAC|nr:hypothetical protein LAZ67_22002113 [Cordylochernes scorpioides]UYV83079.1 hypothetical protein LAZ67_22002115 [Cordylochernes scorpioides]